MEDSEEKIGEPGVLAMNYPACFGLCAGHSRSCLSNELTVEDLDVPVHPNPTIGENLCQSSAQEDGCRGRDEDSGSDRG